MSGFAPFLVCVALLAAGILPAQAGGLAVKWQEVRIPAARQSDVRAASGLRYRLFVAVPPGPVPAAGYPVLYVLDGNAAFSVAAFLARSAASRREVTGQAAPLVVGIGYPGKQDFDVPARRRDYTPSSDAAAAPGSTGGAGRFLEFIETEVKPLVAARYPVDRRRQALFGHSFGGLFVLHALFARPEGFSTYIASSPSIWWADRAVLKGLPGLLASGATPRVQISVGALEDDPPKGNYSPEMRAVIASRLMIPPARELAAGLGEAPAWAGRVAYHEMPGEDHGPAWLPAMTRGMQFFLDQP